MPAKISQMKNWNSGDAHHPIVFFDGTCPFCHFWVRRLLRWDGHKRLRFAPLQGETASRLLTPALRSDPEPESILLWYMGRIYRLSTAIVHIGTFLPLPWKCIVLLKWIPAGLRDGMYRWIAQNRYRWFGKYDSCSLPEPADPARFLS